MTAAQRKSLERAWGFDDVAIVPGAVTTNPDLVEAALTLGEHTFPVPILASAMDAVVDPSFAAALTQAGGLAVLNLEGVQTRYEDPAGIFEEIAAANLEHSTEIIQHVYSQPIRDDLVGRRIEEIIERGGIAAVSATPQNTKPLRADREGRGRELLRRPVHRHDGPPRLALPARPAPRRAGRADRPHPRASSATRSTPGRRWS